jgi:hypothetical protein
MKHELKIWPQFYCRVAEGTKTFQIRKNDRAFQSGDIVVFKEWDPSPVNPTDISPRGYTASPPIEFTIGYIEYLDKNMVVFSLIPQKKNKAQ